MLLPRLQQPSTVRKMTLAFTTNLLTRRYLVRMDKNLKALLRYAATAPTADQLEKIRKILADKLDAPDIEIECVHDETVKGGFIVSCGNFEYDWSDFGRTRQLRTELNEVQTKNGNIDPSQIISMLKEKVEDFELSTKDREVGTVTWVGDGIANIEGIDHAFYGEIIEFEDGTKGMVQDIRDDHVGCILFGNDSGIRQGSRAVRTYKEAGIPVGEAFIGRVVDALGAPLDGQGDIKASGFSPVERPAPGIIERQSVNEPMETGILSIDTMFPIGRGQRELIIGDRQTGKTSIALDTIINQRGKGVICIYVAIGQKASTVAQLYQTLKKNRAMEYTIIVSSTASDMAPLQYIAPYSGTALGEYFMRQGKDVLIVYDDLSKHAVAYRALSLLLERSPGREAYPGDVFYLHSRLLERSSKLSSELGGGSMTALPIIETQAGDVSAYIPTNVISITDGQIFLESDLFFEGMRPAVNVGLSVSRVGSAAQTKAMKKAAGSIRVDLAQYREMAVFTQFSSDLDDTTRNQLNHGSILMELLKQPLEHPLSMHQQVIILVTVGAGRMDHVPVKEVKSYKEKLLKFFETEHSDLCEELEKSGELPDQLKKRILDLADEFNEAEGI
ncbi:MAG: F0F1 ATP synthase subunit alpha [Butyrivibrio sp.]|nr:F0F1 ATP synthase subunit alpha [Butyrivibrio sp.]